MKRLKRVERAFRIPFWIQDHDDEIEQCNRQIEELLQANKALRAEFRCLLRGDAYVAKAKTINARIRSFLDTGALVTKCEIVAHFQETATTASISTTLSRMVRDGEVVHVSRGVYRRLSAAGDRAAPEVTCG